MSASCGRAGTRSATVEAIGEIVIAVSDILINGFAGALGAELALDWPE